MEATASLNDVEYYQSEQARYDVYNFLERQGFKSDKILSSVPKSLYKYSSLNKYTVASLTRGMLNAAMPALFNDPYDSIFHFELHTDNWEKYSEQLSKEEVVKFNKQSRRNDKKMSKMYRAFSQRNSRVLAMTEGDKNTLLWSHYTDSGRGICTKYDFSDSKLILMTYPVIYAGKIVDFSEFGSPINYQDHIAQMTSLACEVCKSVAWEYEKEWRVIMPAAIPGVEIPSRCDLIAPKINRVILGPQFIGYWLQKKRQYIDQGTEDADEKSLHDLFMPFCNFIEKNEIPLYVASIGTDQFEYDTSRTISVYDLKNLNPNRLKDFYDSNLLGCY